MSRLNASRRRKVMILERRRAFLEGLDSSNGWDLAEIAALDFALETISAHYPTKITTPEIEVAA